MPRTDKKPVERNARPRSAPNDRRAELRRQQAALSRAHILDAAEEVFALHGYHDSTIREIANLAGFSPAAVYGFVDSKEQLVAAIMDRHGGVLLELHAAVVARTDSPRRQLEEIIDLQVDYHLAHPNFGRLFQHTIGLSFLAIESTMDDRAVYASAKRSSSSKPCSPVASQRASSTPATPGRLRPCSRR